MKKLLVVLLIALFSCNEKEKSNVNINLDTAFIVIDGHKVHLKIEQEVDKNYLNHKYLVHTKLWAILDTNTVTGAQLQEWNIIFTSPKKLASTQKSEYDKVYKDAIQMLKQ
jgi:hypothetical protein